MGIFYEVRTCTRCGGSGKYSFNLSMGNRCMKCGGSGVQPTKAGDNAKDIVRGQLRELFNTQAKDVKIGDRYLISLSKSSTVEKIDIKESGVLISTKWTNYHCKLNEIVMIEKDRSEILKNALSLNGVYLNKEDSHVF